MDRNIQDAKEIDYENTKISNAITTAKPLVPVHNDYKAMGK